MSLKEICNLMVILKKENEINSIEEKEFNNEWIRLLKQSCYMAIEKAYKKRK